MSVPMTNVLRGLTLAIALSAGLAVAATSEAPLPPPAVPPERAARALEAVPLQNAGFESTRPFRLGAPEGWWIAQHAGPESYRYALDTERKKSGERSLRLENMGPEPFGSIYQKIDAAPWRGRRLRFAAWLRTEGTTGNVYGSGAGLSIGGLRGGYARAEAQMRKDAVHGTTDWTRYEVVLTIPHDVDEIEVGLNLFGPGTAWIDDATLDVVESKEPPPAVPLKPAGRSPLFPL